MKLPDGLARAFGRAALAIAFGALLPCGCAGIDPDDRAGARERSGWAALERAISEDASDKDALLRQARTDFYNALALRPGSYEAALGRGLALYETSRLHDTRTHLTRSLDILGECAARKPDDGRALCAQARAIQRLRGPSDPEALALLAKAFQTDGGPRMAAAYGELYREIAPYPTPAVLRERVPEPELRAVHKLYTDLLSGAAAARGARGEPWNAIRAYLAAYRAWEAGEAALAAGIQEARQALHAPDLSPLDAAEEALRRLDAAADAVGGEEALTGGADYAAARAESVHGLLAALGAEAEQAIEAECFAAAEALIAEAFARIAAEKPAGGPAWTHRFQKLRERQICRKSYIAAREAFRNAYAGKPAEDIRVAIEALGNKHRACIDEHELPALTGELLAAQSAIFQHLLADAGKAAAAGDGAGERTALGQALALAAQKELAHRQPEILLRMARSCAREDRWARVRAHVDAIEEARRPREARMLLGAALAHEDRIEDAALVFARGDLAGDLRKDPRIACAAGIVFARKDRHARAVPLLSAALDAGGAGLPFPPDTVLGTLRASLAALLARGATPADAAVAERLIDAGRGDAALAKALAGYFLGRAQWAEALATIEKTRQWGATPPPGLIVRLKTCIADFAPLAPGRRWEYIRGDGARVAVRCDGDLGGGLFAVSVHAGAARTERQWEKRDGGRTLCRFSGADFERCDALPIGLSDANETAALPVREYEIDGTRWTARVAEIGAAAATPAGEFRDCIRVDVLAPGESEAVRHFFAPGVGEVKVVRPGRENENLDLVSYED